MKKINDYLELIRFNKPIGSLLLFYPILFAYLFVDPFFVEWRILLLFAIASFLMRSSGCIINDLCDVKYDKLVERTKNRPLASGALKKSEALFLLFLFLFSALLILMQLNYQAVLFATSLIIPIILYPLSKRCFKYPQLILALTFNSGIFVLYLSLYEEITYKTFLLYLAFVFLTIGYDTVYAFQDMKDDLLIGVRSTAISFGRYSLIIIDLCYVFFVLIILLLGLQLGFGFGYFVMINLLGLYVYFLMNKLSLGDARNCAEFFVSNNKILFFLAVIIIINNFYYMF